MAIHLGQVSHFTVKRLGLLFGGTWNVKATPPPCEQ
jgi:hypothetical protein